MSFARNVSTATKAPRHLLTIDNLTSDELTKLVDRALVHKKYFKEGNVPESIATSLRGKTVPMLFSKRSTRTRVSTEGAVTYLGGHPMFLGKDDIQLGVNESLYDTSKVISSMTSCMVARVGPHSDIQGLAKGSSVPVINALCEMFHPLQAITDILTIREHFAELKGLKLAWVGDANNVLHDLAIACAKSGINVAAATPKDYPIDIDIVEMIRRAGDETGAVFEVTNDPLVAVKDAHILVTDTWISMGQEAETQLKLKQFAGYQITNDMAAKGGANPDWKFMHCLPRHKEEVDDEVFYSDRSLVFPEAENRLYAAIAVLEAFVVNGGKIE
ncbi:hypothetical protein D0Z00_000175 [Geotrichum galactomycetum]|uniref:Uncharacterized protein n=1 Tax=Geotrichum galactomycetum TaxID=27317 RepID=A0ACB6VAN1_9ASCO|nr:hypothetical protein D0Z00_000175 [Geotrichum candidum]